MPRSISNKGQRILCEERNRYSPEKLVSLGIRCCWYLLAAVVGRRTLAALISFYSHGWRPRRCSNHLTHKEFANRIAIITLSAGAFGAGLGQLVVGIIYVR